MKFLDNHFGGLVLALLALAFIGSMLAGYIIRQEAWMEYRHDCLTAGKTLVPHEDTGWVGCE